MGKIYFNNPKLSDLSIILDDKVIPIHKLVLCRASDYFEKLITGNFKVCYPSDEQGTLAKRNY